MSVTSAAATNAADIAESKVRSQVCKTGEDNFLKRSSDEVLPKAFLHYLNESWTACHAVAARLCEAEGDGEDDDGGDQHGD